MLKLILAILFISILSVSFFNYKQTPEVEKIEHSPIEKIPLYYDLDDPNKTYTRDGDNFVEVDLNGNG